jgi:hypothetical protein
VTGSSRLPKRATPNSLSGCAATAIWPASVSRGRGPTAPACAGTSAVKASMSSTSIVHTSSYASIAASPIPSTPRAPPAACCQAMPRWWPKTRPGSLKRSVSSGSPGKRLSRLERQLSALSASSSSARRRRCANRSAHAKTLAGQATLCARQRPDLNRLGDPTQAAKMALRSVARRIADLDAEIGQLDQQLRPLVATTAPRTMALLGIGTQHAGQLLVTVGENIDRIHSEAGFAHMCAAAPIPASSGQTNRHRLNPYGNRQANRTLHLIAVVRLRYSGPTRAYAERRRAEGMSNKDIIRCLKRYIAREVYRTLRADLAALQGD